MYRPTNQVIIRFLSQTLEPYRVFIALMIAVLLWLFPLVTFAPQPDPKSIDNGVILPADPFTAGALGPCSNVSCSPGYCCSSGYCVPIGQCNVEEDPLPPTITANLSCSQWGSNGWCIGILSLDLSASDPQGQSVIISGDLNGLEFACPSGATACSIPITTEGTGAINYRVNSMTGLASNGFVGYRLDFTSPQINGLLSGVSGTNGWFVSVVTVLASASDATSQVAALDYSLDGGASWVTFPTSLDLTDGVHTLTLRAQDQAGNLAQTTQSIRIDTITPSLSLSQTGTSGLNGWYVSAVQVAPTLSDAGSGIFQTEVSQDGTAYVPYTAPLVFSDGHHTYQFKGTDNAGNITETSLQDVYVDTIAPVIDLPSSWTLGKTVQYSVRDDGSGLQPIRVVIEDEDERYSKLFWDEYPSSGTFTGELAWDGIFRDGKEAPPGDYYATLKVIDVAGNEIWKTGKIVVMEESLQQVLHPLVLPSPIPPTIQAVIVPQLVPTATPVTSFGGTSTTPLRDSTTTTTVQGFVQTPVSTPQSPVAASNILWGTAAAAAVGAFLAEAEQRRREAEEAARRATLERMEELDNKNKRRDGLSYRERGIAYQASLNAYKANLINNGYTPEQAEVLKDHAQTNGKIPSVVSVKQAAQAVPLEGRVETWVDNTAERAYAEYRRGEWDGEQEKVDAWKEQQAAMQAGLAAYYSGMRQAEKDASNWWEYTKAFVREEIIEPVNTHVYQPYLKPAIDKRNEAISWLGEHVYEPYMKPAAEKIITAASNAISWLNEKVYQPYVQPIMEQAIGAVSTGVSWINEHVYQPYIKPELMRELEQLSKELSWINENIYQPYVQPLLTEVNDHIYQPYIQPLLDNGITAAGNIISWINENIYKPFVQPVTSDIYEYIYQPAVEKATAWWDKYGDWVHGGLDAVGFIPGLGDIADGLNGLIYLGEGNYLEASIAAIAMIPVIGDLGKAAKLGVQISSEIVEEAVEKVAKEVAEEVVEKAAKEIAEEVAEEVGEKLIRETGEELASKLAKESLEEATEQVAEKTLREAGEDLAHKVAKETFKEASERALGETSEELAEKAVKEVVEKTTKATTEEGILVAAREAVEAGSGALTKEISETVAEKTSKELVEHINAATTERVLRDVVEGKVIKLPKDVASNLSDEGARELAAKISKEYGGKKVWVSAKTGAVYVSSPPPEAFALVKKLREVDLTNTAEVDKILRQIAELTSRGSGTHVVLGPFRPNGAFIQGALDTNGVFWDVGDELWAEIEATGIDMFRLNDQFLRVQVDRGIDSFDIILKDVNGAIDNFNASPPMDWADIKYTDKEILDLVSMPGIPYKLVGNSFKRV